MIGRKTVVGGHFDVNHLILCPLPDGDDSPGTVNADRKTAVRCRQVGFAVFNGTKNVRRKVHVDLGRVTEPTVVGNINNKIRVLSFGFQSCQLLPNQT